MDQDFVRELIVLGAFLGLYLGLAAVFLRGHTTDLSEVANVAGPATGSALKLNRRRQARAREAAERAARLAENEQGE
jgi:hypothetical protein